MRTTPTTALPERARLAPGPSVSDSLRAALRWPSLRMTGTTIRNGRSIDRMHRSGTSLTMTTSSGQVLLEPVQCGAARFLELRSVGSEMTAVYDDELLGF